MKTTTTRLLIGALLCSVCLALPSNLFGKNRGKDRVLSQDEISKRVEEIRIATFKSFFLEPTKEITVRDMDKIELQMRTEKYFEVIGPKDEDSGYYTESGRPDMKKFEKDYLDYLKTNKDMKRTYRRLKYLLD